MAILIPQDFSEPNDEKGMRKKVRPSDIKSGTYYGQMQVRGSLLFIKDNSTTASGYVAFGTSMTAIPTSPTTGTGILIDYSGIYGNNGGTKQFYILSSDGKAYAGAGAVILGADGITLIAVDATANFLKWSTAGGLVLASTVAYGDAADVHMYTAVTGQDTADYQVYATAGNAYAEFFLVGDDDNHQAYARIVGYSNTVSTPFLGLLVAGTNASTAPSSLLHLQSTAPTFRMEDTTSSAKSLLLTVDANSAIFKEVAGSNLLALDLANEVVTIGAGTGTGVSAQLTRMTGNYSGSGDYLVAAALGNFTGTSADSIQGIEGYVETNHASGTLTRALGVIGHTDHIGAGVTTDSKVFTGSLITRNGAGAITNAFIYKSDGIARIGTPGTITNAYTFYADALPATGVTNRWAFYAPGASDKSHFAGHVLIGDTSNASVTVGLTLNQGAADDEILSLKSSDVAHGMTDLTETDTYFAVRKQSAAAGCAQLIGYSEGTRGLHFQARHTTDNTDKTTSADGAFLVDSQLKSSATVTACGADANLVVFRNNGTARFIFDAEGSGHADVAWTTFDTHDDLALLNLLNAHLTPHDDPLKANFGAWLTQSRDELERLKLVTFGKDGHNFINLTRMHMLEVGALRQIGERLERLEQAMGV
jgi:hypothetical protein